MRHFKNGNYLSGLAAAARQVEKEQTRGMTTEEVAQAAIDTVAQMSPLEKAKLRRILRKEFRTANLYKRVN